MGLIAMSERDLQRSEVLSKVVERRMTIVAAAHVLVSLLEVYGNLRTTSLPMMVESALMRRTTAASVPGHEPLAGDDHLLDKATQAADRPGTPVPAQQINLDSCERGCPALIACALPINSPQQRGG
jgi:hypothetical protein